MIQLIKINKVIVWKSVESRCGTATVMRSRYIISKTDDTGTMFWEVFVSCVESKPGYFNNFN